MRIIDTQLHDPSPWLEWTAEPVEVRHRLLTEITAGYLDAVGVDSVLVFPNDVEWAASAAQALPERIAYVPTLLADTPDIEATVAATSARRSSGQLAVRILIAWPDDGSEVSRLEAGGWDPVFAACEKHGVPIFLWITGWLPLTAQIAEKHPDLVIIIDHFGLSQPPLYDAEVPPFRSISQLTDLARFSNIYVKLCGLPSLSEEAFPYRDVLPHLRTIVDAFGAERLMWAADITRFYGRMAGEVHPRGSGRYVGKHTYAESLHFISHNEVLSEEEKTAILGGSAQRLFGWPSPSVDTNESVK
jgi:predicted TIM-barrel fold metal-dependent hydrolase